MVTKIKTILEMAGANKASDIHLYEGFLPRLRIHGQLVDLTNAGSADANITREEILSLLVESQIEKLKQDKELDFSLEDNNLRFRGNIFFQRGSIGAVLRVVPLEIPGMKDLNLPEILGSFLGIKQGFVLITGPTGQGKSTTVASMLNEINIREPSHIVTIEDPIEYIIKPVRSSITQRELGVDTNTFANSLRSCLRQDPNVVFVGEMRDLETIQLALTVAETGHLVFSTLHTNSAAQTVDRIVDVFSPESQEQIRIQLASVLSAVVSQRLIPGVDGKRVPVFEVMVANSAIRNAIREGKNFMIDNVIQTGVDLGMISMDMSLARAVKAGKIDEQTALSYSIRPGELQNLLRNMKL